MMQMTAEWLSAMSCCLKWVEMGLNGVTFVDEKRDFEVIPRDVVERGWSVFADSTLWDESRF